MYPFIRAEMAEKKITLEILCERLSQDPETKCTLSTLSLKLNGKAPIKLIEAKGIKSALGSDKPIEQLFITDTEVNV